LEKVILRTALSKFWKKIQNEPGVKNFKLFEGASPCLFASMQFSK